MKKLFTLIISALVLAGVILPTSAQQNEPQKKEAKIVKVEEITALLVVDSTEKVVRRIPVSDRAEFFRLQREQHDRRLLKKGENTIPEIPDPRIEFRDSDGRVIHRVSLKEEIKTIPTILKIGNTEKSFNLKEITAQEMYPVMNASGKYITICKNTYIENFIDSKGEERIDNDPLLTGQVIFYDVQGNVLFEKQFPKGKCANSERISDDGEVVTVSVSNTIGGTNEPGIIIYVFKKNGEEILKIPSGGVEGMSPNGKYIAVRVDDTNYRPSKLITRFYNLDNKQYWDADARYAIFNITNEGIARGARSGLSPVMNFDLKTLIKE